MSIKVITRVLDFSEQRGAARLLMVVLADFSNDDGICWPGMAKLSTKIHESERYTLLLIKKLLESGELVRISGGGRGRSTIYGITVGLDSAGRKVLDKALDRAKRLNPVPEYGVSLDRPAPRASQRRSGNPVPGITDPGYTDPDYTDPGCSETPILSDRHKVADSPLGCGGTPIDPIPNRHDPSCVGVGDRARAENPTPADGAPPHVAYLAQRGMGAAATFTNLDPTTAMTDFDNRCADGMPIGVIVEQWRLCPPRPGAIYERRVTRPIRPESAPRRNGRSPPRAANPERDAEYQQLIAEAERQATERSP